MAVSGLLSLLLREVATPRWCLCQHVSPEGLSVAAWTFRSWNYRRKPQILHAIPVPNRLSAKSRHLLQHPVVSSSIQTEFGIFRGPRIQNSETSLLPNHEQSLAARAGRPVTLVDPFRLSRCILDVSPASPMGAVRNVVSADPSARKPGQHNPGSTPVESHTHFPVLQPGVRWTSAAVSGMYGSAGFELIS